MGRFRGLQVTSAVKALQRRSTESQVDFLSKALDRGRLSESTLRYELETTAVKEMRRGIERFARQGTPLTVDLLLGEYDSEPSFQALAARVGLTRDWFADLAEREIAGWNKEAKQ